MNANQFMEREMVVRNHTRNLSICKLIRLKIHRSTKSNSQIQKLISIYAPLHKTPITTTRVEQMPNYLL